METAASSSSSPLLTFFPAKAILKPHSILNLQLCSSTTATASSPPLGSRSFSSLRRKKAHKPKRRPSLPILSKNPHALCNEIQRLTRQGKILESLALLDYATRQGLPVSPTTFSSLIAACVRFKALRQGRQLHAYIFFNSLQNNAFLRTQLLHMYASCGSFRDARLLFDGGDTSVYPWNALLRGNVVSGRRRYHDLLSAFSEMRERGVESNVYTFSCMLKSFAGASALPQGLRAHGLLIKNGLVSSRILRTSLIDFYFKCGKVKLARRVFDEIPERDVVVWGAMIAGFVHNGLAVEALDCVRLMTAEGIDPNSVVLTAILPAVGEVCAHKLGREVHAYLMKTGSYLEHPSVQSALINMYSKCGDMALGRRVFNSSRERSLVSWTALMSGHVSNGKLDQALRSFVWMQQEGFKPDVVAVATVLPVCAKLKALKRGKEVHGYVLRNGFLPNVSLVTSLMVMYSKCGNLKYSYNLFDGTRARNVISWTAMIESCIDNGQLYDALGVFRLMLLSKFRPDSVAIARMLSVCGQVGVSMLGREIHGQVLKKDFQHIPYVSAEIVKMYGRCGSVDKAMLVFDAILMKGPATWTAIIEAHEYNNQYQDAFALFHQMNSGGFTPNHYTLNAVLSVCLQADMAVEACQIFNLVTQSQGIKASDEQYWGIIKLLNRVGCIEEAKKYVRMWSSLS